MRRLILDRRGSHQLFNLNWREGGPFRRDADARRAESSVRPSRSLRPNRATTSGGRRGKGRRGEEGGEERGDHPSSSLHAPPPPPPRRGAADRLHHANGLGRDDPARPPLRAAEAQPAAKGERVVHPPVVRSHRGRDVFRLPHREQARGPRLLLPHRIGEEGSPAPRLRHHQPPQPAAEVADGEGHGRGRGGGEGMRVCVTLPRTEQESRARTPTRMVSGPGRSHLCVGGVRRALNASLRLCGCACQRHVKKEGTPPLASPLSPRHPSPPLAHDAAPP